LLRSENVVYEERWSNALAAGLHDLCETAQFEPIVRGFTRRLQSVASMAPFANETSRKTTLLELEAEIEEFTNELYLIITDKQEESELLRARFKESNWPADHLHNIDIQLSQILRSCIDRIRSLSDCVLEYFSVVDGVFREAFSNSLR
jgi:hypothetical protein